MTHSSNRPVRVRLAPSPTGDPHVGTGYIALFNYAFAGANNGQFILRIEDTDRERSSVESEKAILHSLRWLGLAWDEGPEVGGPYGPYRQSERRDIYRRHAEELLARNAAYRCFCPPARLAAVREEQRKRKLDLGYDGACRTLSDQETRDRLAAGTPQVVRLAVPREGETRFTDLIRGDVVFQNSAIDDQVLLKSDGFPTYHLANVVDDHLMEISHVIRAEEWISSTPKHLLLYAAFGWEPPLFVHMPLLRNPDRSKISKRKNPTSLLWYEAQGYLPEALRNFLALMGWSAPAGQDVFSLDEMIREFSWQRVATSGPVFDLQKLDWLNGVYIRKMSRPDLARLIAETVVKDRAIDQAMVERIMPLVQERMKTLGDFIPLTEYLFAEEAHPSLTDLVPKKSTAETVRRALEKVRDMLASLPLWQTASLEEGCRRVAEEMSLKPRDLFMALRVAVTGTTVSPPLFESMELLGREKSLTRIAAAIGKLTAPG